mgnify:CR=1 FL=1
MNIYEESLKFHKELKGKLEVSSRVKITNEKEADTYCYLSGKLIQ